MQVQFRSSRRYAGGRTHTEPNTNSREPGGCRATGSAGPRGQQTQTRQEATIQGADDQKAREQRATTNRKQIVEELFVLHVQLKVQP